MLVRIINKVSKVIRMEADLEIKGINLVKTIKVRMVQMVVSKEINLETKGLIIKMADNNLVLKMADKMVLNPKVGSRVDNKASKVIRMVKVVDLKVSKDKEINSKAKVKDNKVRINLVNKVSKASNNRIRDKVILHSLMNIL